MLVLVSGVLPTEEDIEAKPRLMDLSHFWLMKLEVYIRVSKKIHMVLMKNWVITTILRV